MNYGHTNDLIQLPRLPLSPQHRLQSLPNYPGVHHCLCLYSNKRQRRRQQLLLSLLLIALWLRTKSFYKLTHNLNNVILNTHSKQSWVGYLKQKIKRIYISQNQPKLTLLGCWQDALLFLSLERREKDKTQSILIYQNEKLTLQI